MDVQVSTVFLADLLEGFHACTVVVEKAVDAFVIAQRIESLVHIRYGVQYDVVLSVQLRIIRAALLSQGQKGEIVHEPLEHIAGIPCFSRLSDVGDFLWGDAALEIAVANLISTRYVGKGDGEIPLAVVGETSFTAFSFRQLRIYSSFLQVGKQGRR